MKIHIKISNLKYTYKIKNKNTNIPALTKICHQIKLPGEPSSNWSIERYKTIATASFITLSPNTRAYKSTST